MQNCNKSQVYQKAYNFAIQIVRISQNLREQNKEYTLSKQLLRSGTSIGANIAEANGAISNADFSNKISIAYKEALETKYWLDLLKDSELIAGEIHHNLYGLAEEISKMLYAILKTTRISRTDNR